ncbi:hypothetical protein [Variovorax sp. UMC13]|uniref:hypothetical protein n=1 Tax=Variovorax sp. UMC13 TaxID=1862326 RepID=UPI0015FF36DB|nr:hypothetical protein [Variovorax sp. UMC13]MBB1598907.1 hypothetical protein [Variovorax sp. UMC13]
MVPDEAHTWQFFRAGGVDQVLIRNGTDIARIGQLDQKLWVALACPASGIEIDPRTLALIDTDSDGRIRPPELIAACEWACRHLKDPDVLMQGGDTLALDAIADAEGEAVPLAEEARRILQLRGKEGADRIALADVTDRSELLAAMRFNGDGVVPPESTDDEALQTLLRRIMKTHGAARDRKGLDGVDRKRAETFFAEAKALHDWQSGEGKDGADGTAMLAAAQAVGALREKVDDFFARCRVAAYDPRAVPALNPSLEDYETLAAQPDLRTQSDGIARLPLAPIAAGRTLPLLRGVNPAWAEALRTLQRDALPLLAADADAAERQEIGEADWRALQERLASCQRWLAARPATQLGGLSATELADSLALQGPLMQLIEDDERVEPHNARIAELEKLLRFQRDLLTLVNNFVAFKDFYRREGAIFQAGRLYLDGRSCDLSVAVADAAKHAPLAGLAKACLAYCVCTRKGEKMTVVSAFTAGDTDFLFVGRNGVFYDRQGRDWDATITKVIENPTSVAQAFFSPYKKFLRMIEEQVAKRAAASDTVAQGSLGSLASTITTADKSLAAGAKPPEPVKLPGRVDVGTVAAIGVALGSISAVLVAVFSKFVDLGQWIPIAVLGLVLAISGPSMLIAWLKLRQRSLGPILDASGWAINGRMHVNVRLGGSLSQTAHLPAHASRVLRDPYAERHRMTGAVATLVAVCALLVLAWRMDWLDGRLPPALQRNPAAVSAPAPPGA